MLFFSASTSARQTEDYSVILVNSFNESYFEVKMMYRLMTQVSAIESILVLTVPAYYADSVESFGPEVKKNILDNFNYQLQNLLRDKQSASFSRLVAIGRHASVFVDTNPTILPQAERYFLHIDWSARSGTLVRSDYEPELSYSQILAALPQTREIYLVHGNLGLEQDDGLIQNFVSNVPARINLKYFNPAKYPDQTLTELRNSAAGTPIIYINYKFHERNWETVHNWLITQTQHPVFTIFSHNVSRYAGGAVVVPERIADAAIALAGGEQLPVHQNTVVSQQFNAQQLERWVSMQRLYRLAQNW